jgi:hypothetical protein
MNKIVHKVISLLLVILLTLLILDYFKIITFTTIIRDSLYFTTLVLIIFSATSTICSTTTAINKFINYIIIIGLFAGLLLYIVQGSLNVLIYSSLLFTTVSALMDMLYKKV